MSNGASTKRVGWMWLVAIAACIAVAVYGFILNAQAVRLEREHDTLQAELRDKQQRKQRLGELVIGSAHKQNHTQLRLTETQAFRISKRRVYVLLP